MRLNNEYKKLGIGVMLALILILLAVWNAYSVEYPFDDSDYDYRFNIFNVTLLTVGDIHYRNGNSINDTILWKNESGFVELKAPQEVKIDGNLTVKNLTIESKIVSTRNDSYISFEDNGDVVIWI